MNSIADKTDVTAYIATAPSIVRLPGIATLLGRPVAHYRTAKNFTDCAGVLTWGRKPSAAFATAFAERHGLSLLRLEDGFLRSLGFGRKEPPLSLVVDDLGIYYDALQPSRLESLIAQPLNLQQQQRANALIAAWRNARVSKYNHAREYTKPLPDHYVLVADQVVGDMSIHYGLAEQASFDRMLQAALDENPDSTVILKIHPGVITGRKQGHFALKILANNPRIQIISDDVHPVSLLERAEAVYCVTSQIGFEGLLWGKKVRTFGMPFYAAWGLTTDDLQVGRRGPIALENLVYGALIAYPRYLDPETNLPCEVERLIAWMGLQRQIRDRFPPAVEALGFSYHKRPIVRRFFQGSQVFFDRKPTAIPENALQVVWGVNGSTPQQPTENNRVYLEDGFIRSIGLGADVIHPVSCVLDTQGIYYDATQPSDLEQLLQNHQFASDLLARAALLRQRLVTERLTKYNVGQSAWQRPDSTAKTVILVPGQVALDASLIFGACEIRENIALLKAVRQSHPDAYIVYKPHPEVVAGFQEANPNDNEAANWCDEIVTDAIMADLLLQVDEVHTISSLAGFEALLRQKKVVCYGWPFYAGWGLTEDRTPLTRRSRRLDLDELVAGVLILYPVYISRSTDKYTTPERALDELLAWRKGATTVLPWWRKGLLKLIKAKRPRKGVSK